MFRAPQRRRRLLEGRSDGSRPAKCVATVAVVAVFAAIAALVVPARAFSADPPLKVAALVTAYFHNSHADMFVSRILQGETLEGRPPYPGMQLASLYVAQFPANDKSRELAKRHAFRVSPTIRDALTLGGDRLAVDGVLLIAEHGEYPESATGSIVYPKRPWFAQIAEVCEASGRGVPVFCDKHLADNWADARWIYDTAARLKMPLVAGSSLPLLWRLPAADTPRDAKLRELVAVSHHRLDTYGFHALEMVQCLAERRAGGESGVRAVQYVEGPGVWEAAERGRFDRRLLDAALARLKERPLPPGRSIEQLERRPQLFLIEYRDGFRAAVLTLNDSVSEWASAWRREGDERIESTLFWTQEARPFMHFAFQLREVEAAFRAGRSAWPVERTLLTTGLLDALLISRRDQGRRMETPHLDFAYRSEWNWQVPPPPPPGRPIPAQ